MKQFLGVGEGLDRCHSCWFGERFACQISNGVLFSSLFTGRVVSSADGWLPFNLIYPW